jgi:hypothetical protein
MERIMLKSEPSQIEQFIRAITQGWHSLDCNPMIEIRCIGASRNVTVGRFALDWIDDAVEHAERMNAAKQNVYMCINPIDGEKAAQIGTGKAAKDTDIAAAFFNFADADTDGAMQNILSFAGPKFTMSIKTGTVPFIRGHAYWQLEEPVFNLDAWRETQRSIAAVLGTDGAVINPSRIMRVAGSVSWPGQDKIAKGYVPELVTMRTEFSADRDPVPFERMMRAFPASAIRTNAGQPTTGLMIDTGAQAMDRAMVEASINAGENWHHNVVRLVASYVSRGLSDAEIHALTDRFTQDGYTVDDTRREVQQAIDGARAKGWTPQPDPVEQMMAAQVPQIATQPTERAVEDEPEPTWPTPARNVNPALLPRREWVYGTTYIRKYVSVTASAGGIGKTSLATVEGLAIATGRDLLGENVRRPSNVWIINLEDPLEEMQLRLSAAMQHYGISYGDISGKLFMDAEDTMRMVMAAEGRDGLIQNDALLDFMVGRINALGIGVVIIDPFVSTHLVNENSNASIQAVVAMFRKLARDTGAAVHLIHHVRKGNGDDATIDSVRGAGSLIGAARSARVINKITEDDALRLGVEEAEARGIFRVDDGKANLAPPAEKAVYRRMIGVQLPNEEWVGVAVDFKLPDPFENITKKMTLDIQNIVAKAEADGEPFRASVQAKQWVGHAIAPVLKLDTDNKAHKAKLSAIIKTWIGNDVLRVETITSKRDGRDVPCVIVGEWITSGVDN